MYNYYRTNSSNDDFIHLVRELDAELSEKDGDDHSFYDQFNKIDNISHVIVAYDNNHPIACGAIKEFDKETMEVKRMYTDPAYRGKGIATKILAELEKWATELSFKKCVLETGKRQPEAISVYQHNGYSIIQNYGQYIGVENSVCFEKQLRSN